MKRIAAAMALAGALTSSAASACQGKAIFSCLTMNHKFVEVCDAGNVILYSFGRLGKKPELAFSTLRSKASTEQWTGIGRYISYSVNLPRGRNVYSVYMAADRANEDHTIEAGVHVFESEKMAATVLCDSKTLRHALEGIDLETNKL
jgi:hypothetical protein